MILRPSGLFLVLLFFLAQFRPNILYAQTDTIQPDTSVFKVVDTAFREIKPVKPKKRDSVSLGIDSTNVYYFSGTIDSLKMGKLHTLDSGTLYFHEYDPLFKYNGIYSTLSNIGLAQKNLVFKLAIILNTRVSPDICIPIAA